MSKQKLEKPETTVQVKQDSSSEKEKKVNIMEFPGENIAATVAEKVRLGEFPKILLYWVISVNYGLSRAIVRTIQYNLSLHRKIFQPILGTLHLPHFNIVIFA